MTPMEQAWAKAIGDAKVTINGREILVVAIIIHGLREIGAKLPGVEAMDVVEAAAKAVSDANALHDAAVVSTKTGLPL